MVNPAPARKDPLNIEELIKQAKGVKKRLKLEKPTAQQKEQEPTESCEACGSCRFTPHSFREHTLCGACIARWKKLDSLLRYAEGREATWEEMLKGLHPSIVLGKE